MGKKDKKVLVHPGRILSSKASVENIKGKTAQPGTHGR